MGELRIPENNGRTSNIVKALLVQLALILGGGVAALSLAWNLSQRMDLLTAAFRAALVFFATVIVLFLFLRFFSMLLVRFVAEQVMKQRNEQEEHEAIQDSGAENKAASHTAAPQT